MLLEQFAVVIQISATRSAQKSSHRNSRRELTFVNALAENSLAPVTLAAATVKRDGNTVRSSEDSRRYQETCMPPLPVWLSDSNLRRCKYNQNQATYLGQQIPRDGILIRSRRNSPFQILRSRLQEPSRFHVTCRTNPSLSLGR
jgi:hypothetical protein